MPSCILVKTPLITFHENNLTAADSQTKINLELAAVQITKRKKNKLNAQELKSFYNRHPVSTLQRWKKLSYCQAFLT